MALWKRIVVPVDFGAPSLRACDRAVALACELRAQTMLVHAIDAPSYTLLPDGLVDLRDLAQRKMRDLANELRRVHEPVETRIVEGTPWRAIASAIDTECPDLVVCGTHNRRGLARLALGSVAERIVRASAAPVMTIPGYAFESREEAGGRLMMELPRYDLPGAVSVVALGLNSVPVAGVVAERLGTVLDVWDYVPIEIDGAIVGALGEDELAYLDVVPDGPASGRMAEAEARARETLREQLAHVRGTGSFGDVLDRLVVLVAEHVGAAAPVRAAVRALRPLGASGIVLVTPVASAAALREVRALVDGVVCLERTVAADPAEIAFRASAPPSYRKVRRLLGTWRASDAPLPSPTRFAS